MTGFRGTLALDRKGNAGQLGGMKAFSRPGFPMRWVAWLLVFLAGLAGGYLLASLAGSPPTFRDFPVRKGEGGLTNPLLDFELTDQNELKELRPFEGELRNVVEQLKQAGAAEEISVYFRDLNNGPWVAADPEKEFTAGSLFKVPLIIACLSQAEHEPGFIGRKILFRDPLPADLTRVHYPPPENLQRGREYSVRELVQRTASYSDNAAAYLLLNTVDKNRLKKVFYDLDLKGETLVEGVSRFSVVEYGRFFRILYNASYLGREMSELALGDFGDSTFLKGLVAGVPRNTVVAHKFGEYEEDTPKGPRVLLHDVGIIYPPKRPYLLCVMTKGRSYEGLERSIATVSSLAWRQVQTHQWKPSP